MWGTTLSFHCHFHIEKWRIHFQMNTKESLKRAVPSAIIAVLATGFILSPQAMAQSSSSSDLGSLSSNGSTSKHQTDKTKTGQDSQTSVSSKNILSRMKRFVLASHSAQRTASLKLRCRKTVTWSSRERIRPSLGRQTSRRLVTSKS